MIAALLVLQALTGLPGFERAPPTEAERIALPHVADAMRDGTQEQRLAALDAAIALMPQPTRFRGSVECFRGHVLMTIAYAAQASQANSPVEDRATPARKAAVAAVEDCLRLNPDVPLAQRIAASVAFQTGEWRKGAALLTKALTADPRLLGELTEDNLSTIFRQLGYAKADAERRALVLALAKTDVARDNAGLYSGWARESVLDRVEKRDLDGAAALLPYVVDPSDGIVMLVDRRYAPLWPRIDEWAGGGLEAQRDALLRAAREAYRVAPTLDHARTLAGVLGQTGHVGEGIALLRERIAAFGAPRDDLDYAMSTVRLSGLIETSGERDADRILSPMREGLKDGVGTMRVTIVPNLARAEIMAGQPAAALATLDRFPVDASKVEAAQAVGYFVALRGCAIAGLGQTAEARRILADVERTYAANTGVRDIAVGCIGSDAELLARWIAQVDDPETRSGALVAMFGARTGANADSRWVGTRRLRDIAMLPQVSERLARYGRAPAPMLLPALRGWLAPMGSAP